MIQNNQTVVRPPDRIFETDIATPSHQLLEQWVTINDFNHAEYPATGGIFCYFTGMKYPKKCFPFPEALSAVNTVKRITRLILAMGWPAFIWRPGKVLDNYIRMADWELRPFYLKDQYYCRLVRELRRMIENFWRYIFAHEAESVRYARSHGLAKVIGTMIEYDNGYRYIIEDIFSEAKFTELYNHPRREIKLLLEVLKKRAEPAVYEKIALAVKILLLALWLPKVKRAIQVALWMSHFEWLQMDEADRYHTMMIGGYNYGGIPLEERMQKYIDMHPNGLPKQFQVKLK